MNKTVFDSKHKRTLLQIAGSPMVIFLLSLIVPVLWGFFRPLESGYFGSIVYGFPMTIWPYILYGWWFNRNSIVIRKIFLTNWQKGIIYGSLMSPIIFLIFLKFGEYYSFWSACKGAGHMVWISKILNMRWDFQSLSSVIFRFHGDSMIEAVVEEIFFRGLLLNLLLLRGKHSRRALIYSSIMFALAHGQPILMPYYFFWGACVGILYMWTGSLFTPIIIHLFNNAFLEFFLQIR